MRCQQGDQLATGGAAAATTVAAAAHAAAAAVAAAVVAAVVAAIAAAVVALPLRCRCAAAAYLSSNVLVISLQQGHTCSAAPARFVG